MRNTKQMVPEWAMRLIVDAQMPAARWIKLPKPTVAAAIDYAIKTIVRIVVAHEAMKQIRLKLRADKRCWRP